MRAIGAPRVRLPMRLALGYAAFFAVVLTALCSGVVLLVRQTLLAELRDHLMTSGELIAAEFETGNGVLEQVFDSPVFLQRTLPHTIGTLETPALFAQVEAPSGALVIRSASLKDETIPLGADTRAAVLAGERRLFEALVHGAPTLVLAQPLTANGAVRGVLLIGRTHTDLDRLLRVLILSLAAVCVITLAATIRGGAWLVARALQPVGTIARTARRIADAADLTDRIPMPPSSDELSELTATINEMLSRMDRLFHTQQRFIADVSHELRTPLAAMRGTLEILRRGAVRDPQALEESLISLECETHRLGRIASDLLALAQADAGIPLHTGPVALDELVLEVVRELRPLADGVALGPRIAEQVELIGDRDRLKQALINLVANALRHTPASGSVTIGLERAENRALLQVSDTGSGIPPDKLPLIFERFYRADTARSREAGGAGLGLAIVRWVAEAHGGTVSVSSAEGAGSVFKLELPLGTPVVAAVHPPQG